MNKKLLLILIVLVLAVTAGCGRKKAPVTAKVEAIPVKVSTVETGDIKEIFTTTGTIEAADQAIVSAKASGRVTYVRVQLGDYISKGQVLVTLERDDVNNQMNQAKVSVVQAELNYKQAKDNFTRKQKLFAEQIISQQEFDSAQNQLDIAESQLKQSHIGVDLVDSQIKNTEVRAPISGYIGSRQVNGGEMVSPGAPLFSIVDLSQVYVTVNLSDSYISQAKVKQQAEVTLAASPDKVFLGSIAQIAPMADAITKTYPTKILLNNSSKVFKDGMLTQVKLNFNEQKNAVKLPIEAIIDETGGKAVYIVENNTAVRKPVEVGISDGKFVQILSGLTGGEQVVVMGQNNLEDGLKVVVK